MDPSAQPTREHGEREVVTIGWIGSRSTSDDLREVLPIVGRLNERGVKARLVLIGAGPLEFTAPCLERRPWSEASEADELASFDIGIMPLPDNEWTRGKCGYKLLQYFAAGVPAVASPVGVNTRIVGDRRERGLLAATPQEWSSSLEELVKDHQARGRDGSRRAALRRGLSTPTSAGRRSSRPCWASSSPDAPRAPYWGPIGSYSRSGPAAVRRTP